MGKDINTVAGKLPHLFRSADSSESIAQRATSGFFPNPSTVACFVSQLEIVQKPIKQIGISGVFNRARGAHGNKNREAASTLMASGVSAFRPVESLLPEGIESMHPPSFTEPLTFNGGLEAEQCPFSTESNTHRIKNTTVTIFFGSDRTILQVDLRRVALVFLLFRRSHCHLESLHLRHLGSVS